MEYRYWTQTGRQQMNYAITQRMRMIEFLINHYGTIGRSEITDFFGVSEPQATRDFREYNALAPGNMLYNKHNRRWVKADTFKAFY